MAPKPPHPEAVTPDPQHYPFAIFSFWAPLTFRNKGYPYFMTGLLGNLEIREPALRHRELAKDWIGLPFFKIPRKDYVPKP